MNYARCVKGCYATLSAKRARVRYDRCWPKREARTGSEIVCLLEDCVAKLDGFVDEGRPRILVSPLTRLSREGSCGLDALTATPDATLTLRKRLMVEHGQGA
jgi:hypothetical protein